MRSINPFILVLSLLVNLVLAGAVWWCGQRLRENEVRSNSKASSAIRTKMVEGVDISSLGPDLVAKLRRSDPEALRDLLDACGADPQSVRSIVTAAIGDRFRPEKIRMLMSAQGGAWWKREPDWWSVPGREEIDRREEAEVDRLVGAYPAIEYPWRQWRWSFLPKEKRVAIDAISRDYAELTKKLPPRPWLPHEEEMSIRLRAEERRDLEALLSDGELVEYDFRANAKSLGDEVGRYSPNEGELRAVYYAQREREQAKKGFLARYPGEVLSDPFAAPLSRDPRAVAEEVAIEQSYQNRLKEIFGAERLERGDREADESFRSIVAVTDKFKVERTQAEALYALLNQARAEANAPVPESVTKEEYEIGRAALRLDILEEMKRRLPPSAVDLLLQEMKWSHHWLHAP